MRPLSALAETARNALRERRVGSLLSRDLRIPPPTEFATFGRNSVILPPGRVTCPDAISIGSDVKILEYAWLSVVRAIDGLEPRFAVGDGSRIGRFFSVACVGRITIGRRVLVADRVFIGDTYHGFEDPQRPILDQPMAEPRPVHIGDGAVLGTGASVMRGVTIGAYALVAPGSVVTSDVAPGIVVAGNSARPIFRWDAEAGGWAPTEMDSLGRGRFNGQGET